jgi:ATP-dependent Lhr-like helicase
VSALADDGDARVDEPAHRALLDVLAHRGAVFWPELVQAVASAGLPYDEVSVLAALWDLVWDGLVTNDTIAPLRALVSGRPGRAAARDRRPGRPPRPGRLARLGPPAGAGRWSLVAPLLEPRPAPTEAAHARATQLLERYGVLTREAALGEGQEGGFAGVYPVLRALEERGQVRRGYFVAGLGGAQFALAGAVDRMRTFRDQGDELAGSTGAGDDPASSAEPAGSARSMVLAATDPAQPYGAALPWPDRAEGASGRPARVSGAHVVLSAGRPVVFVERGAHKLVTFPAIEIVDDWPLALRRLADRGRYRSLEVRAVDGLPVRERVEVADALRAAGFVEGYRGLVYRPGRRRSG